MSENPAVSFKNVFFNYNGMPVLEDITFDIEEGDYLGIIGPNGGGKSTLLKIMLGLIKPSKGKVKIYGKSPYQSRKHIGYVPQYTSFDRQYPINVWDVVMMGRLNKTSLFKKYSDEDERIADESLEKVGMPRVKKRQIGQLSGGQLQRVLIARALAAKPKILLLDEPTTSIDPESETGLYDLLTELNEEMTIIFVSHDVGAISQHVNSIACLNIKLHHHGSKDLTPEVIESVYGCPIDLIAHGTPHRVLKQHGGKGHKHD